MSTETAGRPIVTVEGDASGFAERMTAGIHHFAADESLATGGTDTGPDPYQLLARRARVVYVDDRCSICAAKAMVTDASARRTHTREDLCGGLCSLRHQRWSPGSDRASARLRWPAVD